MKTLLALLLSTSTCLSAPGIPYFARNQSSSTPTIPDPTSIPGLAHWWVSSDLTNGASATNWSDRISTNNWTNTVAAAPIATTNGVYFDGAHYLRGRDLTMNSIDFSGFGSGTTWALFLSPTTPAYDWAGVLNGYSSYYNGGFGFYTMANKTLIFSGSDGSGTLKTFVPSNIYDVVLMISNANFLPTLVWTNGVSAGSINGGGFGIVDLLGCYLAFGPPHYYKGWIIEVMEWTNAITVPNIATLHTYATNKYHYAP